MGDGRPVVLVVEEHADVRRVLVALLGRCGYDALPVACGVDAAAAVGAGARVAAAVVDCRMPAADGVTTVARLRALAPDLPCLLITGGAPPPESAVRACGAASLLAKPIDCDALGRAVAAAIDAVAFPAPVVRAAPVGG